MKNFTLTMLSLLLTTALWAQPCSDLFFSEYIEGDANNKAVEIYNPTSSPINLNGYRLILRGFSGANNTLFAPDTMPLSGTIPSGGVVVVANIGANGTIQGLADITTDSVIAFNGNDAIALFKISTNQIIDAVGDYTAATAPSGGGWAVGTGSTLDHTLVRKPTVQQGTSNWSTGATQWNVFPLNTTTYLGDHCSACIASSDTFVEFTPTGGTIYVNATSAKIAVNLNLCINTTSFTADVVLKSGNAALVGNFTSQTVTFNNVVVDTATITVNASAITTPATLVFALRNPSSGVDLGADSLFTLTINPAVPLTIAQVRGNNTNGLPDSLNIVAIVSGTVLGVNLRTGGLNFTINDGTAGIGVFSPSGNLGYTSVQEGDSIAVTGKVSHFNGLAQMDNLTNITRLGTGTVPTPRLVNDLNEGTEGDLVQLNGLRVYGTPTGTNPLTYDITNGVDSFEMVIYATTGIGTTFPSRFNLIGIGRQFDGGSNGRYNRFYQIGPRKQSDIIDAVGIEEFNKGVTAIYPNPTTHVVNIVLEANTQAETVKVFDFTGRLVMEQGVTAATTIKMDLSSLTNGMYFVQVATAQGTSTHKLVKQ